MSDKTIIERVMNGETVTIKLHKVEDPTVRVNLIVEDNELRNVEISKEEFDKAFEDFDNIFECFDKVFQDRTKNA